MTIPLNDLLVHLKWEEEGAQIPDRVRAQLSQLAAAQAALARQAGLGGAPGGPPGAPLRAGAGRNPFQAEWASNAEILQAMTRDAAKARVAMNDLRDATDEVVPPAAGASRAVGALRTAAAAATFQITGMAGEVGRLLQGFLLFTTGSAGALAAIAALGSLSLAFRAATADARLNREENTRLVASLKELGAHGTMAANRIEIARLEQQLRDPTVGQRIGAAWSWFRGPAFGGVATIEDWRQGIEREIARLRGEIGGAGIDFTAPQRELQRDARLRLEQARVRRDALGLRFDEAPATDTALAEQLRILELEYQKIPPAIAREVAARERQTAEIENATTALSTARTAVEEADLRRAMAGQSPYSVTEALRTRALTRQGLPSAVAAEIAAKERQAALTTDRADLARQLRSPEFALQTLTTLTSGIRQGGAGALGALGSLSLGAAGMKGIAGTAAAGPLGWVGFGLSAISNVFGLFNNAEDRRHRELVRSIEKLGKEVGLDRVTVVFTGPDGHQIRKSLAELESGDAVERIPGPAGATG